MQARLNYRNASTNVSQHRCAQHCLATLLLQVATLKIEEVPMAWRNIVARTWPNDYIPLTNRVRGPYRKLRTEFFPPRFMAQARSARAINRRGKNEDP